MSASGKPSPGDRFALPGRAESPALPPGAVVTPRGPFGGMTGSGLTRCPQEPPARSSRRAGEKLQSHEKKQENQAEKSPLREAGAPSGPGKTGVVFPGKKLQDESVVMLTKPVFRAVINPGD